MPVLGGVSGGGRGGAASCLETVSETLEVLQRCSDPVASGCVARKVTSAAASAGWLRLLRWAWVPRLHPRRHEESSVATPRRDTRRRRGIHEAAESVRGATSEWPTKFTRAGG